MTTRLAALAAILTVTACEGDPRTAPSSEPASAAWTAIRAQLRPDSPRSNDLFQFDDDDVVESWDAPAGRVRVHFTRAGSNAVPEADADESGVPDYVELVGNAYEDVLAFYRDQLAMREPLGDETLGADDNGGDGRFDVYLIDFAGNGDGAFRTDKCGFPGPEHCVGYMVQENDFKGYGYPSLAVATRILASHELFHAVQAAYDAGQNGPMSEGTAVWATERYDSKLSDFEAFLPGFFNNSDRPIDEPLPGPVDPFSYGAAVFFQFLSEWTSADVVRQLWEACENGAGGVANPQWLSALGPLLEAEYGENFADGLTTFVLWNLRTGDFAEAGYGYASAAKYPEVDPELVALPFTDDSYRVYRSAGAYLRAATGDRESVTAAVIDDSPDGGAGLRVAVAMRSANAMTDPLLLDDPSAGVQTIDTAGHTEIVVAIINTDLVGASRKPAVCIGTAAEVQACREAFLTELDAIESDTDGADTWEPDSSTDHLEPADDSVTSPWEEADTAGAADTGPLDGSPADSGSTDSGGDDGGCRTASERGSESGATGLALLALCVVGPLVLRQRRQRHRRA